MLLDIISLSATPGEYAFFLFFLAASWMVGRSTATDWKPIYTAVILTLLLGVGTRFIQFSLYNGEFLSLNRYLVDTILMLVISFLGFRFTRTEQMTRQYHWLYERATPFTWREKA